MATAYETRVQTEYTPVRRDEASVHNAQIKERYRELLQNTEESQLSELSRAETSVRASVLAPERPVSPAFEPVSAPFVSAPEEHVTVHTRVSSPLFTPETLDRTIRESGMEEMFRAPEEAVSSEAALSSAASVAEPVFGNAGVAEMPVAAVNVGETVRESYGLSAFAVKALAAFGATVVLLLSVIGINSRVIAQKTNQLRSLEQRRERLAEETAELEARIEEATSYEKVLEFVQENGMVPSGE